jgi:hypothetical protein
MSQRLIDTYARRAEAGLAPAPAGSVRFGSRAGGDEARLHDARIQVDHPQAACGAAGYFAVVRLHRRLPRRDGRRFRKDDEADRGRRFRCSFSFIYSPPRHAGAELEDSTPADVKSARLSRLQKRIDEQAQVISQAMVGSIQRVLVEGTSKKDVPNWPGAPTTTASSISSAIPADQHLRRCPHHVRAAAQPEGRNCHPRRLRPRVAQAKAGRAAP